MDQIAKQRDDLYILLVKTEKEREEALAKLAAMESQSPGGKVIKWIDSNTAICSGDGFAAADIDAEIYFKPAPSHSQQISQSVPLATVMDLRAYIDEFGRDADLNVIKSELGEMIQRANGTHGRCPSHESEQDKNINHNQTK